MSENEKDVPPEGGEKPIPKKTSWFALNKEIIVPVIAAVAALIIGAGSIIGATVQANHVNQARAAEYGKLLQELREDLEADYRTLKEDTREDIRELRALLYDPPKRRDE